MDLLIAVAGALAGALLGGDRLRRRQRGRAPTVPGCRWHPLLILGAVIGAVIGFGVARAALGIAADRNAEIATVSVFRAATGRPDSRRASPAASSAAPSNGSAGPRPSPSAARPGPRVRVEFARDALRAMGLPALGMVLTVGHRVRPLQGPAGRLQGSGPDRVRRRSPPSSCSAQPSWHPTRRAAASSPHTA